MSKHTWGSALEIRRRDVEMARFERGRGMLGVHADFVEEKRVLRYHEFWTFGLFP